MMNTLFYFYSSWLQLLLLFVLAIYVTHLFNRVHRQVQQTTEKVENFSREANRATVIVTQNLRHLNDKMERLFDHMQLSIENFFNMFHNLDTNQRSENENSNHLHNNQRIFEFFEDDQRREHD